MEFALASVLVKTPPRPRTALVTGVGGQDGIYLARLLRRAGYRVVGTVRPTAVLGDRAVYFEGVEIVRLDQRDRAGFSRLLDALRPDELYNMAGFTSVGASWDHAIEVTETNSLGVVGILDELVRHRDRHGSAPRYFQPSSSEMFGASDHQPQTELTPHHPRSPYAASKSFAHHLTVNYRESFDLFTCTGTLYNHESPIRPEHFVTRKITRAVAAIALGRQDVVTLGNLDIRRDWGFAGDYVQAMHRMLQLDEPRDYIIATGQSRSLAELLDVAFASVGIHDSAAHVLQDPAFMRPADVVELVGDTTRARDEFGWAPTTDFESVIAHMVATDLRRFETGVEECPDYLGE